MKKIIIIILSLFLCFMVILNFVIKYETFTEIKIDNCINNECTNTYKFNSNKIDIINDKNNNYILKINDEQRFNGTNGFPALGDKIYTFDSLIMIEQKVDNLVTSLFLINLDSDINTNNEERIISELDSDARIFLNEFEVKDVFDDNNNFETKEIILYGSNFINENSFYYGNDEISLAVISTCDEYEKHKDKVVGGIYKMKYLGDNKVSDIEKIEEIKLKDYDKINFYDKLCKQK